MSGARRTARWAASNEGRAENLLLLNEDEKDQNEELTVGHGKVEIQNQDSHFPTAQNSLRRKEKTAVYTKRLTRPTRYPDSTTSQTPTYRFRSRRSTYPSTGISGAKAWMGCLQHIPFAKESP